MDGNVETEWQREEQSNYICWKEREGEMNMRRRIERQTLAGRQVSDK